MNIDNIKSLDLANKIPNFYYEILKNWIICGGGQKDNVQKFYQIRQQIIWGNRHIKRKGKCLIFPHWIESDIVYINDIIDKDGLISEKIILSKLQNKTNWISEVQVIKSCIPKEWKKILVSPQSRLSKVTVKVEFQLKSAEKNKLMCLKLQNLTSKDIYKFLLMREDTTATGFNVWRTKFNDMLVPSKIRKNLTFIFNNFHENRIKMFKWKLLHSILVNQELLYKWKIADNPKCNICSETEDYEHFFLKCKFVKCSWTEVENQIFAKIPIGRQVKKLFNLVVGYKGSDENYTDFNVILTLLMYSIYKSYCKSEQKRKKVNIFKIFQREYLWHIQIMRQKHLKVNPFLCKVEEILTVS